MHAKWFAADGMWQVREGRRWWTVVFPNAERPVIANEKPTFISPTGALGKRILAAVTAAQRRGVREGR